jgi:hypothetical protein
MNLTEYAGKIIDDLLRLDLMLTSVVTDNTSFNQRIAKARAEQREKQIAYFNEQIKGKFAPGMEPTITFEGSEPGKENAEYTALLHETIGGMILCRSVDLYHWYLRQVVLLILDANHGLARQWAKELKIKDTSEVDAFEKGQDREKLLTKWFRGAEWKTRELVHEHFQIPLREDLDILVKVRNCIVHNLGKDADGTLGPILKGNNRVSLGVSNGHITVGYNGGDAATKIVISDVSIIDQMLARKFDLTTTTHNSPPISRAYS